MEEGRSDVINLFGYRLSWSQLAWFGHRASGLGVLFYLFMHIVETSTVLFGPDVYNAAVGIFKNLPARLGEVVLMAALVYHALNGLRVIAMDAAVFTGIDFSATGKQLGYGHVVHSDNVHDGSIIPVPVAVISSGPGPVALVVAGTHGDEYEGQILAHELIRELEPGQLNGTVIVVPAANSPAVRAAARVSPIDAGNLNRSYPGNPAWRPHQPGGGADLRAPAAARRLRDRPALGRVELDLPAIELHLPRPGRVAVAPEAAGGAPIGASLRHGGGTADGTRLAFQRR